LCQACHQLWQLPGVDKSALAGMAVTTQRGTMINVDQQGNALRPAMLWLDQRRVDGLKPVRGLWGAAFKLVGMAETVAYIQSEAEANWIRTHQPDIWAKTHKYLMLSGYLTYRLVGRFVDSSSAQVGYVPFDYKKRQWASKRDWKWQAIPLDRRVLPDLVPPTAALGEITMAASEATGIPAGLPVIAAANDKACEALGAGCLAPHMGCLSFGTSASIIVTQAKYRDVRPLIPPFPSAVPNAYNLEIQVYRGFWMVEWFKQQFGQDEQRLAQEHGKQPEELLEALLQRVPPGSLGLLLLPHWSPGLKVPGPEARGAIIGFHARHTRAHVYRAIVEGLAYALREGKEQLERRTKVGIRELRVAGGGSQSDAAMQVAADMFGQVAARPHVYEASALGAAIDAAVGLGLQPKVPTAVAEMTRVGRIFEPDAQAHQTYDLLYRRVYQHMYRTLKPLHEAIGQVASLAAESELTQASFER
jgi:sugar (pentulose or hexulose) kinase